MSQLTITPPQLPTGQPSIIAIGQNITQVAFPFDISTAAIERLDNNLAITTQDGKNIVLENFFATGNNPLPTLQLVDGTVVAGNFLQTINPSLDVTTAAGPAATTAASSGAGDYTDTTGDLINGIDRLGSMGTNQWETATPLTDVSLLSSFVVTEASPSFTVTPPVITPPVTTPPAVTPPPAPEEQGFFTRAVLYTNDTDPDRSGNILFALVHNGKQLDANNTDLTYSVTDPSNSGYFVLPPVINPDGTLLITLTEAGKQALAAASGNLHNWLQVTVANTDLSINDTYQMEVIATKDEKYNVSNEVATLANGETLGFQWHSLNREDVPVNPSDPGFHNGILGDGDYIYTGNGNTYLSLTGGPVLVSTTSTIATGSGNDTIYLQGGHKDYNATWWSTINMGDGDNTLIADGVPNIHALVTTGNGNDYIKYTAIDNSFCGLYGGSINTGAGNDTIEIYSPTGAILGVANSSYNLGSGDDVMTITAGTYGLTNSHLYLESGNDTLTITAGTRGVANSVIHLGNGDDVIHITGAEFGLQGTITSDGSGGNKNITIAGAHYAFNNKYNNTIATGTGNDHIVLGTGVTVNGHDVHFSANAAEQSKGNVNGNIQILTGTGSDTIAIDGNIDTSTLGSWHDNYISTGASSTGAATTGAGTTNVLAVNGSINGLCAGKTDLGIFGDAGNDLITINGNVDHVKIATGGANDSLIINGSISHATVSMGDGNDLVAIDNLGVDAIINGGLGIDTLNVDAITNIALSDLVTGLNGNTFTDFEVLDLSGNASNTLNIDTLLSHLGSSGGLPTSSMLGDADLLAQIANSNVLVVKGDAGQDSVTGISTWTNNGEVTYDGNNYAVYANPAHSDELLLIQSGVSIA